MSDLYEILQVESSASSADIKRAYRKLALKYHPDKVSEDDREEAEIKFKEISSAYEILIDDERRESYDLYGSTDGPSGMPDFNGDPYDNPFGGGQAYGADDFFNFFDGMNNRGGRQQPGRAQKRTEDANMDVKVSLEDLYNGKTIRITSTRNIVCTHCKGSGAKQKAVPKKCGACDGEGTTRKIRRVAPGYVTQDYVDCTSCKGTGKLYRSKDKCKKCDAQKTVEETKILEFDIPKGARSNDTIVLEGESDQYPGKQTGDVRLTYNCQEHPIFQRKGDDLYAKHKITLVDALCGFSKNVLQYLDGRVLNIPIPRGKVVRPGDYIKIPNAGMPVREKRSWFSSGSKKGDLYIEIEIEFPQDNWYLEKNDILKIKNLLPNDLQDKSDIAKQAISEETLTEANIEVVTDFSLVNHGDLPDYSKTPENNNANNNDADDDDYEDAFRYGPGAGAGPQAECTPQ